MLNLIRTWKLPVAMLLGVAIYYILLPLMDGEEEQAFYGIISHVVQPMLIFSMLFLSFIKVNPKDLKPHRWHGVLLLTQGGLFVLFSLLAMACDHLFPSDEGCKLLLECAMLCFICPTATASAVIVQKLGGSLSGDVTYIIICNLMVSILGPLFFPLVEPEVNMQIQGGMTSFLNAFFMIMGKVFPLLLFPLFVALIVRHYAPRLMERMLAIPDLAFYLWLVALALAITVTVRTIVESHISIAILGGFAIVSAICCLVQFSLGRYIGRRWPQPTKAVSELKHPVTIYVDPIERSAITAGQAFGQKNTVFVIWLGLVFLNPVTSVVGGLYSIWHNVINSWQLYKKGDRSQETGERREKIRRFFHEK